MGTGKSTVGAIVADKLGFEFVDTDVLIESRTGLSIPQIFERDGEIGFRNHERELAEELGQMKRIVISTGGGMLIPLAVREIMTKHHLLVCLTASEEEIHKRLTDSDQRPLAKNWRPLLASRQTAYAQMPYQCDTTGKLPEQIAEEIISLWQNASR